MRVSALSHSAQFGKNSNLMRAIGSAMDEAADQQTIINYPMAPGSAAVVAMQAHEELARQHRNGSILTVPLAVSDKIVGALTLERGAPRPFERSTVEVCQAVAALAGPLLEALRRDDRWIGAKIWDATRTQLAHVIGAGHFALKLSLFALALLLSFLIFVKTDYRVSAKILVEPITRRALVAAQNGYIAEAPVRAGDHVAAGQLICRLDDRELKLEYSKWKSQEAQSTKQYYEALGGGNAAQVQVLRAQIEQATAQLALVQEQLDHTRLTAPFAGILVSGDLSQQIGSPVERGKLLFEIAPLDAYRVVLQVDEREIAEVAIGQPGQIVLAGFPHDPLPFTVEKITPVATASEGRNFFRIEARLQHGLARLRPGMEGVGKIEVEPRRWIWVLSHDVVDWLTLKIWQWMP